MVVLPLAALALAVKLAAIGSNIGFNGGGTVVGNGDGAISSLVAMVSTMASVMALALQWQWHQWYCCCCCWQQQLKQF